MFDNGFNVIDVIDMVAQPPQAGVLESLYAGSDSMFEPVTLGDVSRAYLDDSESEDTVMFEAITSTRNRLFRTMTAFIRIFNQSLNGTGLKAGSDGQDLSEGAQKVVGGAEVGKARRIAGIPVMVALIPISDGQSVSILFHSPTSSGAAIKQHDTLTAFKFLLNKKDITHIVAPIRGKDVTLRQTCMSIANLVEKNSERFRKRQALNNSVRAQIEKAQGELDDKDKELQSLIEDADRYKDNAQSVMSKTSSVKDQIEKQRKINADLERQIEKAKKAKAVPIKDTKESILSKMGSNLTEVVPLAGGGKIEATPDGIELTDKAGVKHVFKVARNRDIAAFEQAQKEAVAKVFAAFEAGNIDEVIAANIPAPEEKPPVVELQNMDAAVEALSELITVPIQAISSWVTKNNMAVIDVQAFISDSEITPEIKASYVNSGLKYPEVNENIAELKANFDFYIAHGEDLTRFSGKDVKAVASILIDESIERQKEINVRVNSVISMSDGGDFSKMPPQYVLGEQAAILVIAAMGTKTERRAMIKAIGANSNRVKATTLLERLRKADSLLVENGLEPLFAMKTNEEPPAKEETKDGAFVYLLKARPGGPGTIPEGSVTVHSEYSGDYSEQARHGIVTYDAPLSDEQVSQFELLKVPGDADIQAMAGAISSDIQERGLSEKYANMDSDTIIKFVKPLLAREFPNLPALNESDLEKVLNLAMEDIKTVIASKPKDPQQEVIDFLERMKDYQAPTRGDAQEKQAQVTSAIMALSDAGRIADFEDLANQVVDNLTQNLKRLMG